ncbi:hypothetical protein BM221_009753 [Beauveria bassiana]|uniref:Uncharacterized protein n=1 Tax=Beauveria bassiana TaxID=176275 RepID=A0A2N6NAS5_BEABA|nr:hypothetical protein BM221_009753 [Beauveria bassiana]
MPPTDFEIFVSEFDKRDDCVDVTFCDGTFTWASAAHEKELDSVRAKDVDAQKAFCGRLFQNAGLRAEELVESMHKAIDFFASSILPSYGPEQLPKAFEAYEKRFRRTWISCRMFRKW